MNKLTDVIFNLKSKKSNRHYTHGITPKRVTSGGAILRGLAPGQHKKVAAAASR